jgi:hypothetical protein
VLLILVVVLLGAIAARMTFTQPPALSGPSPSQLSPGLQPLEFEATAEILKLMAELVKDVANRAGLSRRDVRACVFAKAPGDKIRMVPGLTIRMRPPENTMELPIGTGVSGKALQQSATLAARFKPGAKRGRWEWQGVPPAEAAKVNPELRWVVAQAVPLKNPRAVLGVDGLRETSEQRLENVVRLVRGYGPTFRDLIAGLELPVE